MERGILIQKIKELIERKVTSVRVNTYKDYVLRVASGKTGLIIEFWVYKDQITLNYYVGVVADNGKPDTKQFLLDLLRLNEEFIENATGRIFSLTGRGKNPNRVWIESQVFYDNGISLEKQIEMLASEFIKVINTFKKLVREGGNLKRIVNGSNEIIKTTKENEDVNYYYPTEEDYENTRRRLLREGKEKVMVKDVLDIMKNDLEEAGHVLAENWRSVTRENIKIWSRSNED